MTSDQLRQENELLIEMLRTKEAANKQLQLMVEHLQKQIDAMGNDLVVMQRANS